jgi:hypothetical protein
VNELAFVCHTGKLQQLQPTIIINDGFREMYAVRIELNSLAPDRCGYIQDPSAGKDALKLPTRLSRTIRIQSISVATQSNMLNYVQTREALDRLIYIWKIQHCPSC